MTDERSPASSVARHTPAPWVLTAHEDRFEINMGSALKYEGHWEVQHQIRLDWETDYDEDEDAPVIAQVEEGYANARLIAAAPLMLEALRAALAQTEDGLHPSPCDVPDCWVEQTRAAIATAEGGQP